MLRQRGTVEPIATFRPTVGLILRARSRIALPRNLFADLPGTLSEEHVVELLASANVRIERIVSTGQASPPGFWYDQEWCEWVVVLSGSARLLLEGEARPRSMQAGDFVTIGAHVRHRVDWTDPVVPTVWLAIHYRER